MKYKKLREQLARLAGNPSELVKAAPSAFRAHSGVAVLAVRKVGGGALSKADTEQLLADAVAQKQVEIEVDLLAYEQRPGEQNRNFVRFRDGSMMSIGRSGKGKPFLKDHRQYALDARAGTILSSSTEKRAEGDYAIRQTAKLTAPWAVEMALRGLLDSVSIGWHPIGPVLCSVCDAPIFSQCWHCPGDTLREADLGEAGKRLKYDDAGDIVVEWVFSDAELVETSLVNVPGVPTARVEEVRASLSAFVPDFRAALAAGGDFPKEEIDMDPELLAALKLPPNATAAQVLAAVAALQTASAADKAELAIANNTLDAFRKDIDALKSSERQRQEDEFVSSALSTGRIGKGDEDQWRALFAVDQKRASELMAKREPNSATPVGAPRQSGGADPAPTIAPVITGGAPTTARRRPDPLIGKGVAGLVDKLAGDPRALAWALKFGLDDPRFIPNMPTTLGATAIANAADHAAAKIGFHAVFLQELERTSDDELTQLFAPVTSTRGSEEFHFMGDLPQMEEWDRDRKLAALKAYKLGVTNKKWATGLRVKNDDIKDDNLGLLPSQINGLAAKARRHRFDLMVKLLLNGFDGTAYPELGDGLAYDGAFFFSDSHEGGNDNKATAALDANSLSSVSQQLEQMLTLDGSDPLDVYGTHLIVGPKLRTTAEKLLQQERLANGEDNINKGKYKLIVSPRIRGSYDDYWFLADLSHGIKPLMLSMREEISTMETGPNGMPAFTIDELWFGVQARYNVGYFEPRLVVGSAV